MSCLLHKIANILFWLTQFIYHTQVATESIFVTKHQTKIWESFEGEGWVRENTSCAFTSFAIQLSNASFSLGTNWEQLPMLKQGQLCPSLPPTWTTKALPHRWPSAVEDSLVGWRRERCGKPNANVEITGRRKNFCLFYIVAYCPKFIMVNVITGRLQVKSNPQSLPKVSFRPPSSFCAFALSYSTFPPNLCRKFRMSNACKYKAQCLKGANYRHQPITAEGVFDHSHNFFFAFMQYRSFALITLTSSLKTSSTKKHLSLTFSQPYDLFNYLFWNSGLRSRLYVNQMHSQNTVKARASKREVGWYLCDQLRSTQAARHIFRWLSYTAERNSPNLCRDGELLVLQI